MPPRPTSRRSSTGNRAGLAVALVAGILGVGGQILLTGLGSYSQQEGRVAIEQRDQAAADAASVAAPQDALCRTSSNVAAVLAATGLCDRSRQVLGNPVVAQNTAPLTPAQVDALAAAVLPADQPPAPAPNDDLVSGILGRLGGMPEADGLDEATTRAVIAGAIARAQPDPAASPPETSRGEQFTGLRFERDDAGTCQGVVTLTAQDGTSREERTPVGDGACSAPMPDPDPPASTDPPPPATSTDPPPAQTTDPPATPDGGAPVSPSQDPPAIDILPTG